MHFAEIDIPGILLGGERFSPVLSVSHGYDDTHTSFAKFKNL